MVLIWHPLQKSVVDEKFLTAQECGIRLRLLRKWSCISRTDRNNKQHKLWHYWDTCQYKQTRGKMCTQTQTHTLINKNVALFLWFRWLFFVITLLGSEGLFPASQWMSVVTASRLNLSVSNFYPHPALYVHVFVQLLSWSKAKHCQADRRHQDVTSWTSQESWQESRVRGDIEWMVGNRKAGYVCGSDTKE